MTHVTQDLIEIKDAPAVPGLSFRHFRGSSDYPHMVAVVTASTDLDQMERVTNIAMGTEIHNVNEFEDILCLDPSLTLEDVSGSILQNEAGTATKI